jgi:hypothetical protein
VGRLVMGVELGGTEGARSLCQSRAEPQVSTPFRFGLNKQKHPRITNSFIPSLTCHRKPGHTQTAHLRCCFSERL